MKLNICTWNILNPEPSISFMSWKGWIKSNPKYKINPYTIASVDYNRFIEFRSHSIINILNWMLNKSPHPLIICLQEVHPLLLDKLKTLVQSNQIAIGQETQTNFLVTLITKGYITKYKQIYLDKKIALISKIQFHNFKQVISCANIHFYWKWSTIQINTFGQELVSNLKTPFIIAGDFNKPIYMLEEFIGLFDCVLYNSTQDQGFTSTLTHKAISDAKPELGQIDHIMFSSEFIINNSTKYKILSKLLGYKIFYQFEKIIKLFDSKKITNKSEWNDSSLNYGLSDHKPVFVKNIKI
jgi:endonuclease/exonuclease/phosphatase family metal-dependent hydrolase